MDDQVAQLLVGDAGAAHAPVEIDVAQHAVQGVVVGVFQLTQRLVQGIAQVLVQVAEGAPAGDLGHKKAAA